ncbi:FkbM family methyltransferase [Azospirillum brasilense]|nr:FkbM family methyltransferase [Azospirillum brasilense]
MKMAVRKNMNEAKFGMHYFMWLNPEYWDAKKGASIPSKGRYYSSDDKVIKKHMEEIKNLGIDYVIFHIGVVRNDGNYKNTSLIPIAEKAAWHAKEISMQYTFMLDVDITGEPRDSIRPESVFKTLDELGRKGLLSNLPIGPNGKPLIFTFSPPAGGYIKRINAILQENYKNYECRHLVYYSDEIWARSGAALEADGYSKFWEPSPNVKNIGGFSSIISGYNDRALNRPHIVPIVPRSEGIHLYNQFYSALAAGSKHILVYGWNEYLESTEIEPSTTDNGGSYRALLTMISSYKKGEKVSEQDIVTENWKSLIDSSVQNQDITKYNGKIKEGIDINETIDALYQVILGRKADSEGLKHWASQFERGVNIPAIISKISNSAEARTRSASLYSAVSGQVLTEAEFKEEYEVLDIDGLSLLAKRDDPVQNEIRRFGQHEPWVTRALLTRLNPNSVMVDVGANIGALALLAARQVRGGGRVYAVEAHPRNAQILFENARRNNASNLNVLPFALSDQIGSILMLCGHDTTNAAIRHQSADGLTDRRFTIVPTIAFDRLFFDLEKIDLIKVDIEGHEPRMLAGAKESIRRHKPVIVSEFSPEYIRDAGCGTGEGYLEDIVSLGYKISIIHRKKDLEFVGTDIKLTIQRWSEAMKESITHLDLLFEYGT